LTPTINDPENGTTMFSRNRSKTPIETNLLFNFFTKHGMEEAGILTN